MDTKRGVLVVGSAVAALTAGWYIYRYYQKQEHIEQLESEEMVEKFDDRMAEMNQPKKPDRRNTNGHHGRAKSKA